MLYHIDFDHPRNGLEQAMANTRREMEHRGYLSKTIYEVSRHWRHFAAYALECKADQFSVELAEGFLRDREERLQIKGIMLQAYKRAIRLLSDHVRYGRWDRHPKLGAPPPELPPLFAAAFDEFLIMWEQERQVSRNTLSYGRRYLRQWLSFLADKGITSWDGLEGSLVSSFFASRVNMRPNSLCLVACVLRQFFQHLFLQGTVSRDWSDHIPRFRRGARSRLPTIWTAGEVEAMLAAVDRASGVGKRDFALLLMICRMGLRASDVRTLTLEQLDWDRAQLSFLQDKTGRRVTLPLSEEVGSALIDYLRHGRPPSQSRNVFLTAHAPYEPLGEDNHLHVLLTRYRQRAGIPLKPDVARGMHSLRHTVASRLLEAHIPLETIADVLGHASVETTRGYTRIDVDALRQVALDIQEVGNERQ